MTEDQQLALAAGWEDSPSMPLIDATDTIVQDKDETPWTSKPWPRLLLIGVPTLFITWLLFTFVSGGTPKTEIAGQPTEQLDSEEMEALKEELIRLRGENALRSQAADLKGQKRVAPQLKQPKISTQQSSPQAPVRPQNVVRPPAQPQSRSSTTVARLPIKPPSRKIPAIQPAAKAPTPLPVVDPDIPPRLGRVPRQSNQPSVPSNPLERWDYLASIGSYGSSDYDNPGSYGTASGSGYRTIPVSSPSPSNDVITGSYNPSDLGPAEPELVAASNPSTPSQNTPEKLLLTVLSDRLKAGDTAKGKLTTGLAWADDLNVEGQTARIELTETLGEGTIPEGSIIVATVGSLSESGLVILEARSAIINGTSYQLKAGKLNITSRSGEMLAGKQKGQGNDRFLETVGGALLSGLGEASGLINRPSSRSTINVGDGSTSTVVDTLSGQGEDLLAGFVEGATDDLVGVLKKQIKSNDRPDAPPIWSLKPGKKVRITVTETPTF